jgi:RHH-type transcriptional regulator, rel operon repressor / antitoxin RelB
VGRAGCPSVFHVLRRVTLAYMAKETMTVRIEPRTRRVLDKIAEALDRDRTYVVNEALESYIDVHRWQIDHIRQGLREADAGRFVPEAEVKRAIGRLLEKKRVYVT